MADDVIQSLNPGAMYFAEVQVVAHDDTVSDNQNNNNSYRSVSFGTSASLPANLTGTTTRQKAAIEAWKAADPQVTLVTVEVFGEGRFICGYRVTDLGDGTWSYEYAIQNINSHRSARSFSVPAGSCGTVSSIGFHDVFYHSGEVYDGTDWPGAANDESVTWSTSTEAQNPNANALRWGTLYNFRFISNMPPQAATATLGLFRAGSPLTVSFSVLGPSGGIAPSCPADVAAVGERGIVDVFDLFVVLANWGTSGPTGDIAPPCGDGVVDINDLFQLLASWGPCPEPVASGQ
jgi:hypothetical protein